MENNLKKMYIENFIALLYTWNYHNIVNQLYFNLKKDLKHSKILVLQNCYQEILTWK